MAAEKPNPLDLTSATKLPRPGHTRNISRSKSPSRSPARKAEFAARELDPLLKNLSPDSTLEALQAAKAIHGNQAEQNAIVQSISDASESERELGIRAAVAAKKLKEWTEEVNNWPWPNSHDRAWGAGFIQSDSNATTPTSSSYIPQARIKQYEDRLDEIWDAISTLSMDEIKDYVFSSHRPQARSASGHSSAYGRMRDFTALITATVIQSLPVLANLHILLETWSIRLTVLKRIPDLLINLDQMKLGLAAIYEIVKHPAKSRKLTQQELDSAKAMFGDRVSSLGKRVDNLLDLLEGQEDSLPQAWIDTLEDIEHKYAEWVVEAENVVIQNQLAAKEHEAISQHAQHSPTKLPLPPSHSPSPTRSPAENAENFHSGSPTPKRDLSVIKRKPLLEINLPPTRTHRRGISEVSAAESNLSGYSLENAEIIDVHVAPVLPSPRISVINSSTPQPKAIAAQPSPYEKGAHLSPPRPPILQRASTASVEIVPKGNVKEVVLRKSASCEMLATYASNSAVQSMVSTPLFESGDPIYSAAPPRVLAPLDISPSPSLMVDPLALKGRQIAAENLVARPLVPRRSSKRLSMPLLAAFTRPSTPPQATASNSVTLANPVTPPSKPSRPETFDDKLKTILASIPAKIKLSDGSGSESSGISSETSSRSASPTHALKLSPVKNHKQLHGQNSQSGIRIYHLKGGKSRDSPPVKLYVRAVGENGDRIMVRVGGGWADLAEYLREYSLHHGGRGLTERRLEVTGFPTEHPARLLASKPPATKDTRSGRGVSPDIGFDFDLDNESSNEKILSRHAETSPWRPPPVPLATSAMIGQARTTSPARESRRPITPTPVRPGSRISINTSTSPVVTTKVSTGGHYTPLGAAGPVKSSRRATSHTYLRPATNEAWVEGMVNQARAVSGSHVHHQHSHNNESVTSPPSANTIRTVATPSTTTTTSIVSSKVRNTGTASRRLSSWTTTPTPSNSTAANRQSTASPQPPQLTSTSSRDSDESDPALHRQSSKDSDKRRSKMNFGDVGGIRRVFLRKRNDK